MTSYQWKHFPHFYEKTRSIMLTLTMFTILLTGCSQKGNKYINNIHNFSQSSYNTVIDKQTKPLQIAVIPVRYSQEQTDNLKALANYLEENLSRKVEVKIQKDYQKAIDSLVEEKVQIAYLSPLSYVRAKQRNSDIKPILATINKSTGRPWHTSVIIANVNKVKNVKDLSNKRFGFVSTSSTTGFLVPTVELFQTQEIDPQKQFQEVKFFGSHNKSLAALLYGEVDAISVSQETYIKAKKENKINSEKYKKIWESSPLPTDTIVVSSKLEPRLVNGIKKVLLDVPDGIMSVSGVETAGYTIVDDMNYESIRQLKEKINN